MGEQVLQQIRADVAKLLSKSTEDLDGKALYSLIQGPIDSERQARSQAHGGGSTLLLNGLLAAEASLRAKVFGLPPKQIKADF